MKNLQASALPLNYHSTEFCTRDMLRVAIIVTAGEVRPTKSAMEGGSEGKKAQKTSTN